MPDDGEPTLAERVRGALWVIVGVAVTAGWLALQVLSTGAGCWFWAC